MLEYQSNNRPITSTYSTFPRRATWQSGDSKKKAAKSIRFSPTSTMMHVRIPSAKEAGIRWYTYEQEAHFKSLLCADAARQSCVYLMAKEKNPHEALPMEELIKCVGLAHLLSTDVRARCEELKENRRVHAHAVLKEQERHRELGERCDESLASVSRLSSKKDSVRALKVAYL